jgi:asparagine synthase (glutamine-hydrolysing)
MCGIAGAVGSLDPSIMQAAQRMNHAQSHRGPDDQGLWKSIEGDAGDGAIFAFRRLAIIDLSADAHQPMIDPDIGNAIIFNGEIYNYQLLRNELTRDYGVEFRSKSDTEVILKAYARWGLEAISRLRGMFAFALWDARSRTVVLARDRVGIKPLYLYTLDRAGDKTVLLFASELRSILASGFVQRRLNRAALSTYLWNGFVVGPETIVEGVRLLPAGTVAIVSAADSRCELHRYWQLPRSTADRASHKDDREPIEKLRSSLETAARQHMVSDVPVGVFLSGGIDSSAVAALTARTGGGAGSRVRTFNISFDEAEYDESRYAAAVAKSLGTDHTEVRLDQSSFSKHLNDALNSIDQPTFDAINTYFISRAVREAGITVALAGTGGDELFGGYRSFVDIPRAARVGRKLAMVPEPMLRMAATGVARIKSGHFGDVPPQTRWGKLGDGLATRGRLLDLYQTSYSLFTRSFMNELLESGVHEETRSGLPVLRARELAAMVNGYCDWHSISMLELSCFIGERLLRDTDAASMAVSLEARVPLLDHEVIEAAANVHSSRRFEPLGKKMLLRELALDEIDPAIFDRPKSGFVLPIDLWCRQQLHDELTATFEDSDLCASVGLNQKSILRLWHAFLAGAPGIYWSRVWSLFILLWWCRTHRVTL